MHGRGDDVSSGMLFVNEMFGPTVQGEGRSQGRTVVFLRLGMCNLDCAWCDTPYTWDWTGKNGQAYDKATEVRRMTFDEAEHELRLLLGDSASHIVISGGEPMLQQRRLAPFIERLNEYGITTEIETNGTVVPDEAMMDLAWQGILYWNCSPKLANSGIEYDRRIVPDALAHYRDLPADMKFVVANDDDVAEVEHLCGTVLRGVERERVYLMPEGTDTQTILGRLPWVMEQASRRGWCVSPRLHVLAYGNKRGI